MNNTKQATSAKCTDFVRILPPDILPFIFGHFTLRELVEMSHVNDEVWRDFIWTWDEVWRNRPH
jgi:hypothetical protein